MLLGVFTFWLVAGLVPVLFGTVSGALLGVVGVCPDDVAGTGLFSRVLGDRLVVVGKGTADLLSVVVGVTDFLSFIMVEGRSACVLLKNAIPSFL